MNPCQIFIQILRILHLRAEGPRHHVAITLPFGQEAVNVACRIGRDYRKTFSCSIQKVTMEVTEDAKGRHKDGDNENN